MRSGFALSLLSLPSNILIILLNVKYYVHLLSFEEVYESGVNDDGGVNCCSYSGCFFASNTDDECVTLYHRVLSLLIAILVLNGFQLVILLFHIYILWRTLRSLNFHRYKTLETLYRSTDVFLTHDWGFDEDGRSTHDRVKRINQQLQSLGIKTWFDEDQLVGNVLAQMSEGIDRTKCVIVFITERYMKKVNSSDGRDNCQFEFEYAFRQLGSDRIIPVVMESKMRKTVDWVGVFGGEYVYI